MLGIYSQQNVPTPPHVRFVVAGGAGIIWMIIGLKIGLSWRRVPILAWVLEILVSIVIGGYIWLVATAYLIYDF